MYRGLRFLFLCEPLCPLRLCVVFCLSSFLFPLQVLPSLTSVYPDPVGVGRLPVLVSTLPSICPQFS